MYCIWGTLLAWAMKPQHFRNWSGLHGCVLKPSPLRCFAQLPTCLRASPSMQNRLQDEGPAEGVLSLQEQRFPGEGQQHQQWGRRLGLTPSFVVAAARAVDLLLPALTCCCRPSLNLQGCSELCMPCGAPYDPEGSCLPCPVLVQPCLHEWNSGTTIINTMPSKNVSYLFS